MSDGIAKIDDRVTGAWISLSVDPALKNKIRQAAVADRRSIASYVRLLITDAICVDEGKTNV